MKASPCFIQHTENGYQATPNTKTFHESFFFCLHRKLNTKRDSKERKTIVKERFKKNPNKKIQVSSYHLFRAD